MDSYLLRFERYATAQKWEPDKWATGLSALLQGKALDVYALMPKEDALNYDKLKVASVGSDVVSVSCYGVRFSVMFHFMIVHNTFSSVWVAEWPPFGNSCPLD